MTLKTVAVSISAAQSAGTIPTNATITWTLTGADIDAATGELVVPDKTVMTLDPVTGTAIAHKWPNTRGNQGSQYLVVIEDVSAGYRIAKRVTVPDYDCDLYSLFNFTTTTTSGIPTLSQLAASTGSSLVGFVQSGTGAVARTVQDDAREAFKLSQFTDPAAAVTAMYAAGGREMKIPAGVYTLTSGITNAGDKNFILKGEGYGASRLATSTASVVPLSIGQSGADNNNVNISLRDFGITGAAGTGNGLNLTRLHNVQVQNLRVQSNGGDGVYADRCYAQTYYSLYSNNNTGAGFHAAPGQGTNGNDNTVLFNSRFLGNGTHGVHIEGSAPGFLMIGCDVEGNPVGLQMDGGTLLQSEAVTILGNYFENQTGKNISIGEDVGATRLIRGLTLQGNKFNPGTVSASANTVSMSNVVGGVVCNNHFSTVNLVASGCTQMVIGPNNYSTANGPWGTGTTEPMRYFLSSVGQDFVHGWQPNGWNTRHRIGVPYSGDAFVVAMNIAPTSISAGTQDDATIGSSMLVLAGGSGGIRRCSAGGGAALSNVIGWDANGTLVSQLKVDVIATASLPAAGSTQDGRIVIESAAGSTENLIIYANGRRWRITGTSF